jgi:hypothetical protein
MNRRKISAVGAITASALIWCDTVRADPDYNYVYQMAVLHQSLAQQQCAEITYGGHDYLNCVYGVMGQVAQYWYAVYTNALATDAYCVQHLIYCTTDEYGITQTYGAVAENAGYLAAILFGLSS